MKYQSKIDQIRSGTFTRAELVKLRINAASIYLKSSDADARVVIDEIDKASPKDRNIVFMGFCPDADIGNRLDVEWKMKGICTFDFPESSHQFNRFNDICVSDLIVLKKRQQFGKTMCLYGHGRVTGINYGQDKCRYLEMSWSSQEEIIEVPLMGCNSTVDVRTIDQVEDEMPDSFYLRLNHKS